MATSKVADTQDRGMPEPASISRLCSLAQELKSTVRRRDPAALVLALELQIRTSCIFETVCHVFPDNLEVFAQALKEYATEGEEEVAAPQLDA
jgi:hypothetical protein